ncbi:MAG TPA: class I SAM-dependent methyltransferase [Chitinophagaceae bacterium]|jgi:2-polyprenyl-3-methyl-5-hydroxy-6-metoxy-1,4-benzoquinol methylase|nr:class I SAM-dependent methyltransferase [Chitinophagaceae bacterium]
MLDFFRKRTPKFYCIQRAFGRKKFSLLDVGAGNHSASKTKKLFPQCDYYGIDLDRHFNNDENDFAVMKVFYEMDLTLLKFNNIPDDHFDFIRMTHIIEHLHNGDEVIKNLLPKLKREGFIYIEYPGQKSTTLPSMKGTLNFYDDPTHVRIYSVKELTELLTTNNCSMISSGTRRNWVFLLAMPFRIIGSLLKGKRPQANIFWDILGFAEFVYAKKN